MVNPFFKNNGPIKLFEILKELNIKFDTFDKDQDIFDIKDLLTSKENEITFFHSKKYKDIAKKTKASFCLTTDNLKNELSKNCKPIIVNNVLVATSSITTKFYPEAINDNFDETAEFIGDTKYKNKVTFGKNVLIGDNVTIGLNCLIGHNTIIEKNVSIGNNCSIGSNTIIRNSLIKDRVKILDNCVIGKHGFGFFPLKNANIRYPHIGIVIIEDNCEIGCGSTIDRGSMSNTIIGRNVSIGNNCSIGSNTIIRNSLIKDRVKILDNCVIGKHGFGFFPLKNANIRYPHIGIVIIEDNCEIGCGSTIDRGSMSNTIIGRNTYLDNQIHIAHNVKIGENSIIAGQVGIAGSSIIGNNVKIGGQAGISGHLKIGNNVEIAGGSGVIKNIIDNSKVMGYPAKNIRKFLKENKW